MTTITAGGGISAISSLVSKGVILRDIARPAEAMAKAQVELTANVLCGDRGLVPRVTKKVLAVVGAYYSLNAGEVEILNGTHA